ncbi:hypothetical protein BUALT_Bualt18G0096700 [Buddleja alternifolia]|uniref:Cystatin domain-containing protein n=1 Tax=Buddleja alternifolia TaxID=168488 RepID=A0AAV6W4U0_9LAMI|nr:hypothetical protein BUALT_Bualt18G0096700 [Buddleja alternifolia]
MGMKSQCLLLVVVFSLYVSFNYSQVSATGSSWRPIKSKNRDVMALGRFAVIEHNKEKHTDLKFERVLDGASRLDDEKLYVKLTIAAKNGDTEHNYKALVIEIPGRGFKSLISFTKE